MATILNRQIIGSIQEAALRRVGKKRSLDCVFYIDQRVLPQGTWLGPRSEGLPSPQAVLVFVDEQPTAGFAHACRYLLYDPVSARLISEHPAQFPPYPDVWPKTYRRFGPRKPPAHLRRVGSHLRTPKAMRMGVVGTLKPPSGPVALSIGQAGRRLAVFLAGRPDPATLNTMGFGYRTLLRLGYDAADIRIANHLGHATPKCAKWMTQGITPDWAGAEGQPFAMKVGHPGSRKGFLDALEKLDPQPQDSLFIHTSGHGGHDDVGSYLSTTMGNYYARDFRKDLEDLTVSELVVMMQQCHSGGFRHAVRNCGSAPRIAFASAAAWDKEACNDQDNDFDGAWNIFARDWFGAQNGGYYRNRQLYSNPDATPPGNGDSHVDAVEAFLYARNTPDAHLDDRPQQGYRPQTVLASKRLRLDGSHTT